MNLKQNLELPIIIHWWNMGTKTIDFEGTIKECIKDKDIKYRKVKVKEIGSIIIHKYIFTYTIGCGKFRYETTEDFQGAIVKVIGFQLLYLGDKAQIKFLGRTRNYN